jgi:hypothetical protein
MGRRNLVHSYKMLDAITLTSTQTSATTNVEQMDNATIHIRWTGTAPVGTITVQARNGKDDPWFDLSFGTAAIDITGASGDHQILFKEMPFTDITVKYNFVSGTGTLTATLTMRTIGA